MRRVALPLTLLALFATFTPGPAEAAQPIKVGIVSVFDFVSEWRHEGAQFAADDINAAGGILGRPVELVFREDPALGEQGVRELIQDEGVDLLVGPEAFTATQNNSELIRQSGVINFLDLSPVGDVTALGNPNVFRLIPYDRIMAQALFDFITGPRQAQRIAMLRSDDFVGRSGSGAVKDALSVLGRQLVAEQTFQMGDADMTPQAASLRESNADALFVWGLARDAAQAVKAVRNLGWDVTIVAPIQSLTDEFVSLAGTAAEGVISVLPHRTINNWAPPGSWRANWFARYHERFTIEAIPGTQVPALPIAQAVVYDTLMLYKAAAERAGSTEAERIVDVLEHTREDPIAGVTNDFAFAPGDHEAYHTGDLWAFRVARGAFNFDIDPRADVQKETEAWQIFATGLLYNRRTGNALIPLGIGSFARGEPARVGDLEWTSVKTRRRNLVRVPYFALPPRFPRGEYAVVTLSVTNLGDARKVPFVFATDAAGNLYLPDAQATAGLWIAGGPDAEFFMFRPIGPGETATGVVAFDVDPFAEGLRVGVPDDFFIERYAMLEA
jgi:branched-chain amino acid transport system substrate-binding protein